MEINKTYGSSEIKEVYRIVSSLTSREKMILGFRFGFCDGEYHTLEECTKEFGVTRERIRQIEAKAIEKLCISINIKESNQIT